MSAEKNFRCLGQVLGRGIHRDAKVKVLSVVGAEDTVLDAEHILVDDVDDADSLLESSHVVGHGNHGNSNFKGDARVSLPLLAVDTEESHGLICAEELLHNLT